MTISANLRKSAAIGAVAALGAAFVGPALAQDYGYGYGYSSDGSDITVRASPRAERDPATGAPIDYVSETRVVSYGDLDLNTSYGVHVLRARIERAAADACDDMSNRYLVVSDDRRACIDAATSRAMYEMPAGRIMYGLSD